MITDEEYEEFVRTLIKPSAQLDAEVTEDEKMLLLDLGAYVHANHHRSKPDPIQSIRLLFFHFPHFHELFFSADKVHRKQQDQLFFIAPINFSVFVCLVL